MLVFPRGGSNVHLINHMATEIFTRQNLHEGARWPCGRALDSESRGPGFDPHKGHCVVSLSQTH